MADVFGRDVYKGAPFSADSAHMLFATGDVQGGPSFQREGVAGMLIQGLNITYGQRITRLWEIGGNRQYFVAGRSDGRIRINRIIGPVSLTDAFYSAFFDVCSLASGSNLLAFAFNRFCGGNATRLTVNNSENPWSYIYCSGCVVQQVNYQVQTPQEMVISEGVDIMFIRMSWKFEPTTEGPAY